MQESAKSGTGGRCLEGLPPGASGQGSEGGLVGRKKKHCIEGADERGQTFLEAREGGEFGKKRGNLKKGDRCRRPVSVRARLTVRFP